MTFCPCCTNAFARGMYFDETYKVVHIESHKSSCRCPHSGTSLMLKSTFGFLCCSIRAPGNVAIHARLIHETKQRIGGSNKFIFLGSGWVCRRSLPLEMHQDMCSCSSACQDSLLPEYSKELAIRSSGPILPNFRPALTPSFSPHNDCQTHLSTARRSQNKSGTPQLRISWGTQYCSGAKSPAGEAEEPPDRQLMSDLPVRL